MPPAATRSASPCRSAVMMDPMTARTGTAPIRVEGEHIFDVQTALLAELDVANVRIACSDGSELLQRRIDQASDEDIEFVTLQHASASEIVRIMTALTQTQRSDGAPVTTSLVADARTNSVLIGGDRADRLRLRTLIAHLDTPLDAGGDLLVRLADGLTDG